MSAEKPDLSDPDYARFAWGRYRRLMAWMMLVALLAVCGTLAILRYTYGPMPIHMIIATTIGIGLTVLLGTALMGLVFLSSGSGHDEAIMDFSKEDDDE